MLELLAFLLPVAAASGWYAAQRRYRSDYLRHRAKAFHESYTRGVGFLLQDKVDEALEALSPVIHSDGEGFELRLALGHLFRKKGLVEKALALHENLSSLAGLTKDQVEFVSYQLGMDYLAAGLLDRAETAFKALLETERYRAEALRQLLKIYQRERDWWQAIECARQLRRIQKLPHGETVAQFYCELADNALTAGDSEGAWRLLRTALEEDAHCVRATMGMGALLVESAAWADALGVLSQVERQDAAFVSEILDLVASCFKGMQGDDDFNNYLRHAYLQHGSEDAACMLVERLKCSDDINGAIAFVQEALGRTPSLKLSRKLVMLLLRSAEGAQREALHLILQALPDPTSDPARYRCHRCGFQARELHWNCPSCHGWETIKPKH
ncbi:MAG: lipopolysaccharide assembly protein LapB [Methylotetracoccus sp.]|nr:lipopolysaccharide assembly protein LapB [Methylotetracoccus sp.]